MPSSAWPQRAPRAAAGVITGCDAAHEWMLDWWWRNYSRRNTLPVAFLDFGLTPTARSWCQSRGSVISVCPSPLPTDRTHVTSALALAWEEVYDVEVWRSRAAWFKKPRGLLETPFTRTLWCDVDTEILDDVTPALQHCSSKHGVGICREPAYSEQVAREKGMLREGERVFNSGVIVFDHASPLIARWAEACTIDISSSLGDQNVLSRLISDEAWDVAELPAIYNWRMGLGENPEAVIVHWVGVWGKDVIRRKVSSTADPKGLQLP